MGPHLGSGRHRGRRGREEEARHPTPRRLASALFTRSARVSFGRPEVTSSATTVASRFPTSASPTRSTCQIQRPTASRSADSNALVCDRADSLHNVRNKRTLAR